MLIAALFVLSIFFDKNGLTQEISYSKFESLVADDCVSKITVFSNKDLLEAEVKSSCIEQVFGEEVDTLTTTALIKVAIPSVEEFEKMITKYRSEGIYTGDYRYEKARSYDEILWSVIPFLLMIFFFMFIKRIVMFFKGEDMKVQMNIDRAAKMHLDNQDEELENKENSLTPTITSTNVIKEEKTTIVQPIIIQTDEQGRLKNIQYITPTPAPQIEEQNPVAIENKNDILNNDNGREDDE